MRGEYFHLTNADVAYVRFIPTCVENIDRKQPRLLWTAVHPHMRGEYSFPVLLMTRSVGSSPHAWRISLTDIPLDIKDRFIPTCVENMAAGKTTLWALVGSSPHAWRIFRRYTRKPKGRRFIPTCVENIRPISSNSFQIAVHPHMRGEYACGFA